MLPVIVICLAWRLCFSASVTAIASASSAVVIRCVAFARRNCCCSRLASWNEPIAVGQSDGSRIQSSQLVSYPAAAVGRTGSPLANGRGLESEVR